MDNTAMKNVLIVDDEHEFLLSIKAGLDDYRDKFRVLTAANGNEAVKILKNNDIGLVVTDLKMPEMDGFELLVYTNTNFPSIPMVVMSAFATPETEEKLIAMGVHKVLEKPVGLEELTHAIITGLENGSKEGSLSGISLASFLQLIEMEQKTCLLEIHDESKKVGLLYFKGGILLDALYSGKLGEDAVLNMLCIDNVQISFGKLPKRQLKKRIKRGLISLIMEAAKQKDEALADADSSESVKDKSKSKTNTFMEVDQMALEKYLQELKEIKGYKASAVLNFTGEILVSDSKDTSIDLNIVGATFNDIFRSAHEASKKIGLDACNKATIETPLGVIVMSCSGVKSKSHFHVIGVLAADGNQALMRMQIDKIISQVMNELS